MTFEYLFLVALLLLVPILMVIQYFRFKDRKKLWSHFQHPDRWNKHILFSDSGHYFWQKVLLLLGIIFLIISLMRPQLGERFETIQRSGRQVYFVVDTSLSMLAEDGLPNRLDAAKYHMQQLLTKLTNDHVALVPYASTAYVYLPLTNDSSAIDLFVNDMFVGIIGSAGSNITNALDIVAKNIRSNKSSSATIIVFSDGEFTPDLSSQKIPSIFKGIAINSVVVGLGSRQGEPIPLKSSDTNAISYKKDSTGNIVLSKRLDQQLNVLAKQTNGIMIEGEISPLTADKIYQYLSKLETKKLEEKQRVIKIDRYHWFLFIALIFLLIEFLYPKIKRKYFSKIMTVFCLLLPLTHSAYAAHPGNNAYNDQDFSLAKSKFESELIKNPDNPNINYNLGNTYYKMGNYDQAIKAYEEALPDLNDSEQLDAYYNIGTAHLKNNQLKDALRNYREVLKRNPNHLKTKQNLEWALKQVNQQQNQPQSSSTDDSNNDESQDAENENQDNNNPNEDNTSQNNERSEDAPDDSDTKDAPAMNDSQEEELTEQQIQYLVDSAEKAAREKRQQKIDKLFKEDLW